MKGVGGDAKGAARRRATVAPHSADYAPSHLWTSKGERLLLPGGVLRALAETRPRDAAAADGEAADEEAVQAASEEPDALEETVAAVAAVPDYAGRGWRKVFDLEAANDMLETRGKGDRERRDQLRAWVQQMSRNDGYRKVNPFPERLDALRERFPNFVRAIDAIEALAALSRHSESEPPAEPILLVGEPGIGKTFFVEALAESAAVDLGSVALGSAQGGFQITGTSLHWANPAPGQVWQLLAGGEAANAILLLDELDKMAGDERYRTESSLLDLLDPRTATRFREHSMELSFDASLLLRIATANRLEMLSPPIRSRFEIIPIAPPTAVQLAEIYRRQWTQLCRGVATPPPLAPELVDDLVRRRVVPREANRRLRLSLGLALRDRAAAVRTLYEMQGQPVQRMGFL
ncbi:AAA family ATPase [Aromatoleum aromaticum]|uniref:AAA family ATPase n=1 Tax=Aromatoleum aromaticum TaxID=551760 RepID=UPI0014599982|nr:AAA family ATPase [Aromatoleum aromaticum]NMG56684.1 AAA family ATPase [Aromatoleum aromaticum]